MKRLLVGLGLALFLWGVLSVVLVLTEGGGNAALPWSQGNETAKKVEAVTFSKGEKPELPDGVTTTLRKPVTLSEPGFSDVEVLRQELESTRSRLDRISRPLSKDILSSLVRAEIGESESLVQGGFQTMSGDYEITFLKPRSVFLADGSDAIEVSAQVIAVGREFVDANGLGTLATNARNTLQHGEAWADREVETVMRSVQQTKGTTVLTAPKLIAKPSQPFSLAVGEVDNPAFSLEGVVERRENGSFLIESRIERVDSPILEETKSGGVSF